MVRGGYPNFYKKLCRRRTRRIFAFVYPILLITAGYFIYKNWFYVDVCYSEKCVALAEHIEAFVNQSADPCSGFHDFVCGNFEGSKNTAYEQKNVFRKLKERKNRAIRELISNNSLNNEYIIYGSLRTQRRFYRLCLQFQSERLKLKENKILQTDIQELSKPPWSQLTHNHVWLVPMIMAKRRGAFHNFFLTMEIQHKAATRFPSFHIGPPSMDLLKMIKPLENTQNVEKMIKIIEYFGKFKVKSSLNTTQDLSKIVKSFLNRVPEFHRRQSIGVFRTEFQNLHKYMSPYSKFDIPAFIEEFVKWDGLTAKTIINLSVDFTDDSYFNFLGNLVRSVPQRIWTLFAVATIILKECPYLSGWARRDCSLISGQAKTEPEYLKLSEKEFCLKESQYYFPKVAEAAYIRNMINTEKAPRAQGIIRDVLWQIGSALRMNTHIPNQILDELIKLIYGIKYMVGWHTSNTDEVQAELYLNYWKIENNSNDTMEMRRHLDRALFSSTIADGIMLMNEQIPLSRRHQLKNGPDVFFDVKFRDFIVLASLLTDPIMTSNDTMYLEYATVGSMVGKALINAISPIVNSSINSEFKKQVTNFMTQQQKCIGSRAKMFLTEQSYQYQFGDQFNARFLADVIGTQVAYNALEATDIKDQMTLPGLSYNRRQLFWIMASTYMCRWSDWMLDPDEYGDVPSTSFQHNAYSVQYMIEAPMLHSVQFAKDFNCVSDDYMSSFEKCDNLFVQL